jgi:Cu(I)/Ag(I) efflux system protein CusF
MQVTNRKELSMMTTRSMLAAVMFAAMAATGTAALADSASATGQVTKIDSEAGKVTIKHGPIKAMDMSDPMTMVYQVKDPAALKAIKSGDNVKFDLDHDTSGYVVTHIEKK